MEPALNRWPTGLLRGAAALVLAVASVGAHAQAHQVRDAGYVLRSSTAPSQYLDAASARAHHIKPSPRRAVLNVVVLHDVNGKMEPVKADVKASVRDLTGRVRTITMREVAGNGRFSYIGAYDVAPGRQLEFQISAQPRDSSVTLKLHYRDEQPRG